MTPFPRRLAATALALLLVAAGAVQAQEAAIRKNLQERLPRMGKVDEVSASAMPGLYEVRIGTDIFYTDAQANFVIQGPLLDTRNKRNLTDEKVARLTAVDFDTLPVKDAFTIVRGNGKRRLALFEDPNCGYCKQFERELAKVDNVTIHVFLYPILGTGSVEKSRDIWCARDKARAWTDWMVRDVSPPAAPAPGCDASALERNVALGKKHQVTGTPTLLFTNGHRVPGSIDAAQVEKLLAEAK